jgi:hypothetical protein
MKEVFDAESLEQLLRNRFCPPAYAFLPQVRNGTGYLKTTRTVDAIAMGLWPSRGLYLNGFEIKVRRNDWFNELKNPEKAEEIAQFCDFFYVVAPKDIVKIEEVPNNWGLMIPHGATTKVIKEARQLKTTPIDKLFLAAILRKAQETITPETKLIKARTEGFKNGKKSAEVDFKYDKEKHNELQKTIREFESKSGVRIDKWHYEDIGEAVKMVLAGEHLRAKEELQSLLKKAERITEQIKKVLSNGGKK